jgi:predicted aspartyl protease
VPILNIQFTAQDASGQPIPPLIVLQQRGPVVQVAVSIEQHVAQQLLAQGVTLPAPEIGWALMDTGASSTCSDEAAAERLNLPTIDVVTVASASHASTQQNVHPIHIEVIGGAITINAPRAIAASLAAQGLLVLMGRDVLQHCTLFYNGLTGMFSRSVYAGASWSVLWVYHPERVQCPQGRRS